MSWGGGGDTEGEIGGGGGVGGHMGKVGGGEEGMEVRLERRTAWDSENC